MNFLMICFYQVVSHIRDKSFARILLSTKKSLFVLTISNRSPSTLVWDVCHTWCSTHMRILPTACGSFCKWLSIVSWHSELVCDILTTFIYFSGYQSSACSRILMSFVMQVLVLIMDKWRIIGILFGQSWINLNWILSSWLTYLLSLSNWVPILSIVLVVYSTMRFHPLVFHLVLYWIWSSVRLRWGPLDIATLHSALSTDCNLIICFKLVCRWYNSLGCIHGLNLRIS